MKNTSSKENLLRAISACSFVFGEWIQNNAVCKLGNLYLSRISFGK